MPVSPPRPTLPPLNALRAFEAAARLSGFRAAAEELRVTPAAVSQMVRLLEDWAGLRLFLRKSRGVSLTEDGARVAAAFTRAFDAMGEATAALRQGTGADAPPITIATLPAIAQLWLPARLGPLRTALGHRQISVIALEEPPNLLRETYDLSLFLRRPGDGEALIDDSVFPVCAAHLADTISAPEDLARHTLLHDASWLTDWATWAEHAGVKLPNHADGPRYSLYSLLLAEAKAGAGVALGHGFLVQESLRDGSLVRPFDTMRSTGMALVLDLSPRFTTAEAAAIRAVFNDG